jgi:SAM-dependent methyltransferase
MTSIGPEPSVSEPHSIRADALRLERLLEVCQRPAPFEPGAQLFWDDPYISQQMLAAHLDPDTDAASRRPQVIEQTVQWLVSHLTLQQGDSILDLGCGPGLYCERFSRYGLAVTGIDYSHRSIAYATARAAEAGLAIRYLWGNYVHLDYPAGLDAVFMIYGDLCVLPPTARDIVLRKVHVALKEGGHFVCDVSTRRHRQHVGLRKSWRVVESGFWRPVPYLVLEQGFDYPEQDLYLDQYIVVTGDGRMAVYRNWFQDYTLETITSVLRERGFSVRAAWSDLSGTAYDPGAAWIGIVARKD